MSKNYLKESILKRLLNYIPSGYEKNVGSFPWDIEMPVAMELETFHTEIQNISDKHFIKTSNGADLDDNLRPFGVARKQSTYAVGTVTFLGESGARISIGDRCASESGIVFYTTESGVCDKNGKCTVGIQCSGTGSAGNIDAGLINKIPVTLYNIVSVSNEFSTAGGSDKETDDELKLRFDERNKSVYTPGSKSWYEIEALSVDGVGDAKCIPLWNGGGTVKIIILNSVGGEADPSLIKRVGDHFYEPPIGAEVTIDSVAIIKINITVNPVFSSDADENIVKSEFIETVELYLKTISVDGGTIYFNKIASLLMNNAGVDDYTNLKINNTTENITITDGYTIPTLGVVEFG